MKKLFFNQFFLVGILLLLLTGCGDKKIDSSTDEAMESSIIAIKKSLSKEKQKEFDDAIKTLSFSAIGNFFEAAANPGETRKKIRERLNGKTANEIIAEAKLVLTKREKEADIHQKDLEFKEKKLIENKIKIAPKGAFGVNFGSVYTPPERESKYNTGTLTTGEKIYFIGAPKKFRKFEDAILLITPKTHKIYAIWSKAKFDNKDQARAEYQIVSGLLQKKYKINPKTRLNLDGDACAFDFYVCEIYLCADTFLDNSTVEIRYTDSKLEKLAKQERLEIEAAKSDNSAI